MAAVDTGPVSVGMWDGVGLVSAEDLAATMVDPTSVKCPKCGAYAGMPCRVGTGYGGAHPARTDKAVSVANG